MGRYLEIADQAVSGLETQPITESGSKISSPTHCEISELSEISPFVQVHALRRRLLRESRNELQRTAWDDWEWISGDPARLIAFASLEAIRQIRESGKCPDTYTATTECNRCGNVPIFDGCPPQVLECPWCLNRLRGLPIPDVRMSSA